MILRLQGLSAASLPPEVSQAWIEFVSGTSSAESERVAVVSGAASWVGHNLYIEAAPDGLAHIRVVAVRSGTERRIAEIAVESERYREQDVSIGVGAIGVVMCTITRAEQEQVVASPREPFAAIAGLGLGVQDIIGSEPILPSSVRSKPAGAGELDDVSAAYLPGVEAKLLELLAHFFALESTRAFCSVAPQNVAVGLRADASLSPFAKPKLPRAPRHLPQRWSVSGRLKLPLTPTTLQLRSRRSKRQTWSQAEAHDSRRGSADRSTAHTPRAGSRRGSKSEEGEGAALGLGLSELRAELLDSAAELRRRFVASSAPADSQEDDFSTFWLPLPSAEGDGAAAFAATAELGSGELLPLELALARSAERQRRQSQTTPEPEPRGGKPDEPQPVPQGGLFLFPPPAERPDRAGQRRERGRSSLMVASAPHERLRQRVQDAFAAGQGGGAGAVSASLLPDEGASRPRTPPLGCLDFVRVCGELLELPHYVGHALFQEISSLGAQPAQPGVSFEQLEAFLGPLRVQPDEKRRVFDALLGPSAPSPGGGGGGGSARREVSARRLELVVRGVLALHPGLRFLQDHSEFREAYATTVLARVLFAHGGPGRSSVGWREWRASELTDLLFGLQAEPDINRAADLFSYNDFYVGWCLFWELDEDEDGLLGPEQLLRYESYALSPRAVERLFAVQLGPGRALPRPPGAEQQASARGDSAVEAAPAAEAGAGAAVGEGGGSGRGSSRMGYADFVCFLLAEEDKGSRASLRLWFRVLDLDCDGVLGRQDMRWFYEEQHARMVELGEEAIDFAEMCNELHDMVAPAVPGRITLADLERSGLAVQVIDALVNIRKLVAWEGLACQKAAGRAGHLRDSRSWDLFVEKHYARLVEAEEEKEATEDSFAETVLNTDGVEEAEDPNEATDSDDL